MSDIKCDREFVDVAPKKPWTSKTPEASFEPLINRIEEHTQSDLFRSSGKYTGNEDFYALSQDADASGHAEFKKTFENGVVLFAQQTKGWPTRLELEDKAHHLKETTKFDETVHRITEDKVEYCGVSRERKFSEQGETYRAYSFDGGKVEKTGALPVLRLEHK